MELHVLEMQQPQEYKCISCNTISPKMYEHTAEDAISVLNTYPIQIC